MTTKKDEPEFLLTPDDPKYKEPKKPKQIKSHLHISANELRAVKRPGILRTYYHCLKEVVLS